MCVCLDQLEKFAVEIFPSLYSFRLSNATGSDMWLNLQTRKKIVCFYVVNRI